MVVVADSSREPSANQESLQPLTRARRPTLGTKFIVNFLFVFNFSSLVSHAESLMEIIATKSVKLKALRRGGDVVSQVNFCCE